MLNVRDTLGVTGKRAKIKRAVLESETMVYMSE